MEKNRPWGRYHPIQCPGEWPPKQRPRRGVKEQMRRLSRHAAYVRNQPAAPIQAAGWLIGLKRGQETYFLAHPALFMTSTWVLLYFSTHLPNSSPSMYLASKTFLSRKPWKSLRSKTFFNSPA